MTKPQQPAIARRARSKFLATGAGVFSALAVVRFPAGAAEFTYKCSTDVAGEHPIAIRATEAAAKITAASNGRLEIRVFPNQVLGGQNAIMGLLRAGGVDMAVNFDGITETVVPVAGMSAIPFAFATHKDAYAAMDGGLGKYIRAAIGKVGLYAMDRAWDAGFRELENYLRPVRTPADIKGLKIRIPDSPIESGLFKSLGASPTQVNSNEMYAALQTHLADGLEVPLVVLTSRKLYEVQKYVSYTNHMWTSYQVLVNNDSWQKLPPDLRTLTERNFNAAALLTREDAIKADTTLEATLKAQGMLFNNVDIPAFRAALKASGFYTQWREHYGVEAWTQLENLVGPLR